MQYGMLPCGGALTSLINKLPCFRLYIAYKLGISSYLRKKISEKYQEERRLCLLYICFILSQSVKRVDKGVYQSQLESVMDSKAFIPRMLVFIVLFNVLPSSLGATDCKLLIIFIPTKNTQFLY